MLALNDNQATRHDLVAVHFAQAREMGFAGLRHTTQVTVETDHGRLRARRGWASDDPEVLAWLDPKGTWPAKRLKAGRDQTYLLNVLAA